MPILRTVVVSCVISAVIVGGGVAIFYLTCPRTSPAETPANIPAPNLPRLWSDKRSAEVAGAFTKDRVWVYGWENGIPDGWVKFDEESGPKKTSVTIPKSFFKDRVEPHTNGRAIEASEYSGYVVLAVDELQDPLADDGFAWGNLRVMVAITWTAPNQERSAFASFEWNGKVKFQKKDQPRGNPENSAIKATLPSQSYSWEKTDSSAKLGTGSGAENENWFELKIVDPATISQRQ